MAQRRSRRRTEADQAMDLGRILVTIDDLKSLRGILLDRPEISEDLQFSFSPDRISDFEDMRAVPDPNALTMWVESSTFTMMLSDEEAWVAGDRFDHASVRLWARSLRTSKLSQRVRRIILVRTAITGTLAGTGVYPVVHAIMKPTLLTVYTAVVWTLAAIFSACTFVLWARVIRSHAIFFPGSREEFRKSDTETRRHRRQIGIAVGAALLAASVAISTALLLKK